MKSKDIKCNRQGHYILIEGIKCSEKVKNNMVKGRDWRRPETLSWSYGHRSLLPCQVLCDIFLPWERSDLFCVKHHTSVSCALPYSAQGGEQANVFLKRHGSCLGNYHFWISRVCQLLYIFISPNSHHTLVSFRVWVFSNFIDMEMEVQRVVVT